MTLPLTLFALLIALLAGAVLGANLFIRFPNLLGVGLVLAVVLHGWLQRWSVRRVLAWSGAYLLGWGAGVAAIGLLIVVHGHGDLYWQSLTGILDKAADDSSTHSSSMLLRLFVSDHLRAAVLAFLVMLAGVPVLRFCMKQRPEVERAGVLLSAVVLAAAFWVIESWKWAVPGLLYLGLFWIAWREWRHRPQFVVAAFVAAAVLVLAPLGSGNGIRNAVYGYWLALPLVLAWLWRAPPSAIPFLSDPRAGRLAVITLALALTGFSLVTSWLYTYRDSANRLALIEPLEHPLLVGTLTTRERAKVVNELLGALPNWVEPGDTLLAYPDLPTVHYLARTRAWLHNPWPIIDRERKIREKLATRQLEQAPLPVVVRSLGVTRNFHWPLDSARDEEPDREAAWQVFDRFVADNGYRTVWNNDFFEILIPD